MVSTSSITSPVYKKRGYLDVGLAVLKQGDNGYEVVQFAPLQRERQVELECNLEPGSYVVVPR